MGTAARRGGAATAAALIAAVLSLLGAVGAAAAPGHHAPADAPPALADKPVKSRSTMSLTASSVHRGDLVTLSGSGFAPGASVAVTFQAPGVTVATTAADDTGNFSVTVAVPASASGGQHHFQAEGRGPGGATVDITAPVRVTGTSHRGTPWVVALAMVLLTVLLVGAAALAWARLSSHRPLTPER